jgi:hydroxymethylglutaryl-CoA lyase
VAERVPLPALAGQFSRHVRAGDRQCDTRRFEMGVATFDCSVAGLGGWPVRERRDRQRRQRGRLYLLEGLGFDTGVDMTRLRRAGQYISDFLGREPVVRAWRAR